MARNSERKAHKRLQLPWWKYGYNTSLALSRMSKPPRVGWTCSGLISSPPERMCTLKWQAWANHDDEGGESFCLMGAQRVQGNASGKQTHAEIHLKKKCTVTLRDVMGKHYCERSYSSAGKQTRLLTFFWPCGFDIMAWCSPANGTLSTFLVCCFVDCLLMFAYPSRKHA